MHIQTINIDQHNNNHQKQRTNMDKEGVICVRMMQTKTMLLVTELL